MIKIMIEKIIAPTEKRTDPTKKFIADCNSNLIFSLFYFNFWCAQWGSNPRLEVLETPAFPLGYERIVLFRDINR